MSLEPLYEGIVPLENTAGGEYLFQDIVSQLECR